MTTRNTLAVTAITTLALVLSACSGGSDATTDAGAGSSTTAAAATSSSSTSEATTTTVDTTTTTTEPETTTTGAETTTTTEAQDEYALALSSDGLVVVEVASGSTTMLPFGTTQDIAINGVTNLIGPPTEVNPGNPECGNGQDVVAIWTDSIMLEFAESTFIAWSLRPGSTLTDLSGVGLGMSRPDLEGRWAISVDESTLGTEFTTAIDGAGYGGLLTADTDSGVIDGLWAGPICAFR